MKKILLITLSLTGLVWADFSKVGGVVTDSITGLEWQDDTTATTMKWESAISYCEGLNLDEGGWRLPTINELVSLFKDTRINYSSISPVFQNTPPGNYWSSTSYAGNPSDAWNIDFKWGGSQRNRAKSTNYYVRCVRDGQ